MTREDRQVVFWARGKGGKDRGAKGAAGADEEDVFVWWHRGDGRSYLMSVGSDLFRVSIGGEWLPKKCALTCVPEYTY